MPGTRTEHKRIFGPYAKSIVTVRRTALHAISVKKPAKLLQAKRFDCKGPVATEKKEKPEGFS
jgi:hypothetical protein